MKTLPYVAAVFVFLCCFLANVVVDVGNYLRDHNPTSGQLISYTGNSVFFYGAFSTVVCFLPLLALTFVGTWLWRKFSHSQSS